MGAANLKAFSKICAHIGLLRGLGSRGEIE
jgi:hypothetical protein